MTQLSLGVVHQYGSVELCWLKKKTISILEQIVPEFSQGWPCEVYFFHITYAESYFRYDVANMQVIGAFGKECSMIRVLRMTTLTLPRELATGAELSKGLVRTVIA